MDGRQPLSGLLTWSSCQPEFFDGHVCTKKTMMMTTHPYDLFDITPRDTLRIAREGNIPLLAIIAKRLAHQPDRIGDVIRRFWESFEYLVDDDNRLPEYLHVPEQFGYDDCEYCGGRLYTTNKPLKVIDDHNKYVEPHFVTPSALRMRLAERPNYVVYDHALDRLGKDKINIIVDAIKKVGGNQHSLIRRSLAYDSTSVYHIISHVSIRSLLTYIDIHGPIRVDPYLMSLVPTEQIERLLLMDLGEHEAFFVVAEAIIREIGTLSIIAKAANYFVSMAIHHLHGGPIVDKINTAHMACIDFSVDASCFSTEVMEQFMDEHYQSLELSNIDAIIRHHPSIDMPPRKVYRDIPCEGLDELVYDGWKRLIPDDEVIDCVDGCDVAGLCHSFMTNEVFRWYMRSMAPMWHARIVGVVKMVKIFVDGWKTVSIGFSDVAIIAVCD